MKVYGVFRLWPESGDELLALYETREDAEQRAETERGTPGYDPPVRVRTEYVIPKGGNTK